MQVGPVLSRVASLGHPAVDESMKDLALNVFRRPPERLNCAQAVLHAYTQASGREVMPVSTLKAFGGARARWSLWCPLRSLHHHASKAEVLRSRFTQQLGSTKCRELRAKKGSVRRLRCHSGRAFGERSGRVWIC